MAAGSTLSPPTPHYSVNGNAVSSKRKFVGKGALKMEAATDRASITFMWSLQFANWLAGVFLRIEPENTLHQHVRHSFIRVCVYFHIYIYMNSFISGCVYISIYIWIYMNIYIYIWTLSRGREIPIKKKEYVFHSFESKLFMTFSRHGNCCSYQMSTYRKE